MMEIFFIILGLLIFIILIFSWIGMWNCDSKRPTDYELYGMDADEYEKKMMGEKDYEQMLKDYEGNEKNC